MDDVSLRRNLESGVSFRKPDPCIEQNEKLLSDFDRVYIHDSENTKISWSRDILNGLCGP